VNGCGPQQVGLTGVLYCISGDAVEKEKRFKWLLDDQEIEVPLQAAVRSG